MSVKTSIIIPSRNEIFLQKTIDSVLKNARGDIEVIAYLDGYWPQPPIVDDPRVVLIHDPEVRGMRAGINAAANVARGTYLCKLDGHCIVGEGFDEILSSEIDKDWIVIPRRYSLNGETWQVENNGKIRDAHYLSYPTAFGDDTYLGFGMHVKDWYERGAARKDVLLDDEMISQGSCWFMHRDYFLRFGGLQEDGYGTFIQESQQMMLRAWLTGGRVLCNKKTWYGHLWKGRKWGRMYDLSRAESKAGEIYSADYWYHNRFPDRVHDLEWLIDKFWPVPTWPENWKNLTIKFPNKEEIIMSVPEVQKTEETVIVKKTTRDEAVNFVLNKFGVGKINKLPVEIDYNRSQWGKLFHELGYTTGAEIGVFGGEYSERLIENNPGVKHYCIDPYLIYKGLPGYGRQRTMSNAEAEAHERLAKYPNVTFIKKFSMDAVKDFANNSLDYVYIDGNHDFQNVTNDMVEWQKKVRPGGIVSGHDFDKHYFSTRCHVLQAVTGYTAAVGIYPWFIMSDACKTNDTDGNNMTSWFWVKA